MTLRDSFAGQATEADIEEHREFDFIDEDLEIVAKYTREQAKYLYADAMLRAREGGDA